MFAYEIIIEGNGVVYETDEFTTRKEANLDAKEMCKHLISDRLNSEGEANLTWDCIEINIYEY